MRGGGARSLLGRCLLRQGPCARSPQQLTPQQPHQQQQLCQLRDPPVLLQQQAAAGRGHALLQSLFGPQPPAVIWGAGSRQAQLASLLEPGRSTAVGAAAGTASHRQWARGLAGLAGSGAPAAPAASRQRPRCLLPPQPPQQLPLGAQQQAPRSMATRVEQQAAANPGLKFWKPTSPGQRGRVTVRRTGIWQGKPMRSLTRGVPRIGGRNCYGRITVRHRGGGAKRKLRDVDFKRRPAAGEGTVERLEYDPNRSGYIALVRYAPPAGASNPLQAAYSYVLAPQDLAPGDTIASGPGAAIKPGNTLPLKDIPVGMPINSIELHPGKGGQLARAAGCVATIVNKQQEHAIVRLPSGEQRLINLKCRATIGAVSNPQNKNRVLAKAGAKRNLGRRPKVRGVAMNPVDHPMGGGTAGGRPSCSPWGLHAKGKKTRYKHKASNRWILSRRTKKGRR